MMTKIIVAGMVSASVFSANLFADGLNEKVQQLATKQTELSHKVLKAYKVGDTSAALNIANELETSFKKLKTIKSNDETSNMLKYLSLCIQDIKNIASKKYSKENIDILDDLSASIQEGSLYIARNM